MHFVFPRTPPPRAPRAPSLFRAARARPPSNRAALAYDAAAIKFRGTSKGTTLNFPPPKPARRVQTGGGRSRQSSTSADASSNAYKRSFPQRAARCEKGHALVRVTTTKELGCDKCLKLFAAGITLHGCKACDYDLCDTCAKSAKQSNPAEGEGAMRDEDENEDDGEGEGAAAMLPPRKKLKKQAKKVTPDSSTAYTGVRQQSFGFNATWISRIKIKGVPIHLGTFTSPVEAARAYDRVVVHTRGSAAKTNFPLPVEDGEGSWWPKGEKAPWS